MCGITGFLGASSQQAADQVIGAMTRTLRHRGPDAQAFWLDQAHGIALGHTRLSILDLSPHGAQPMHSNSGRYVLAFNGEIYNFQEIKRKLEADNPLLSWRGHSDTEILLAAIERWGFGASVRMLDGMFAIALWDRQCLELTLARDRIGEKPLYYGVHRNVLIFGSEMKSLRRHPAYTQHVDTESIRELLSYGYISAPHSIEQNTRKLLPGHFIVVSCSDIASGLPAPKSYWHLTDGLAATAGAVFDGSDQLAIDVLESLLVKAVGERMVSDVPLGAFLSGGIDSSTIVALMQKQSSAPIRTFSIGFDEAGFNEAEQARAVAEHLGTQHTELIVRAKDAFAVIPTLPALYDEPFADSSQIPTFLVSQLARGEVTVALSGDAGDELFGGYNRHIVAQPLWRRMQQTPMMLRKPVSALLGSLPAGFWDGFFALLNRVVPARLQIRMAADKMYKLSVALQCESIEALYDSFLRIGSRSLLNPQSVSRRDGSLPRFTVPGLSPTEQMMMLDTLGYLPNDILVKLDRASMGVSLESRVPFLANEVVEFSQRLPLHLKVRNGQGKWILRQVLYRHVPQAMVERPKMGFALPIAAWLRGPLRDWAEDLLSDIHPCIDRSAVLELWRELMSGRGGHAQIWAVLMFEAWRRESGHNTPPEL